MLVPISIKQNKFTVGTMFKNRNRKCYIPKK